MSSDVKKIGSNIVAGVRSESETNGDHVLEIVAADGAQSFATIPAADVQDVIAKLQGALFLRVFRQAVGPTATKPESVDHLRLYTLTASHTAHRGKETDLSITTKELGSFLLKGEDKTFSGLKSTIDNLLRNRATSWRVN